MLTIDSSGHIISARIKLAISHNIERGDMSVINGIIVHQTDASTSQSTFNSYKNAKANGAHFLIDKDGTIYQTASIYKKTWHVGMLRSRCAAELCCKPITPFNAKLENQTEKKKTFPFRYPSNEDSIGIELVGKSFTKPLPKKPNNVEYETVTAEQNASLKWLVKELSMTFGVSMNEVFRHPDVSFKTESEAATAQW